MSRILIGDCRESMRGLIAQGVKVQMAVTSPPYWGLRDYGVAGQLGLEPTPDEYVENMVGVFRLVRELLHEEGTLWLNLGDCYATGAGKVGDHPGGGEQGARWRGDVDRIRDEKRGYRGDREGHEGKHAYKGEARIGPQTQPNRMLIPGLKPKDLVGIPWRVAMALQADGCADHKAVKTIDRVRSELLDAYAGEPIPERVIAVLERLDAEYMEAKGNSWWLRRDVIWDKKNCMPESVTDRPTTSHEYLFLLARSERYFYDHEAIKEPQDENERTRRLKQYERGVDTVYDLKRQDESHGQHAPSETGCARSVRARQELALRGTRNKRSVWRIGTQPYAGAHFAVFPEELVEPCILAGTSARSHCPKCGAAWRRVMGESVPAAGRDSGNIERKYRQEHGGVADHPGHQGHSIPWSPSVPQTTGWKPGCSCGQPPVPGVVFDPFMGSGTTAQVALRLGRHYLGTELNPAYAELHKARTVQAGLVLA